MYLNPEPSVQIYGFSPHGWGKMIIYKDIETAKKEYGYLYVEWIKSQ